MNRTTLLRRLKKTGEDFAKNTLQRESLRWTIAELSFNLRSTYPAGAEKAFLAAAATESGFSEGDIGNLVRAYEVKQDLTQVQRDKVETWTTDAALVLRGKDMTPAKRTALIKKAETKNTQNVKTLREIKKGIVGGSSRNRRSKQDETIALAKALEKDITRLFAKHDVLSLIAGAQLAQDHAGKDVASALVFANAQVSKKAVVSN